MAVTLYDDGGWSVEEQTYGIVSVDVLNGICLDLQSIGVHRLFFFFQAEDGIRDVAVTGVQTCALPISRNFRAAGASQCPGDVADAHRSFSPRFVAAAELCVDERGCVRRAFRRAGGDAGKIGRASCRERV